jgi:hypothetical protein
MPEISRTISIATSRRDQHQRFGEQRFGELHAPSAQRRANRHFAAARRTAREQQVRDVHADDQQHERGHADQELERALGARAQRPPAELAGSEGDAPRTELLGRLRRQVLRVRREDRRLDVVQNAAIEAVEHRIGLLEGHARREAPEEIDPIVEEPARIVRVVRAERRDHGPAHRQRHEDVRPHAEDRAREALGRDADDLEVRAVDGQPLAEHVRVAGEPALPVVVAEHDDGRLADLRLVLGHDEPAERRRKAQHAEVVAGHERAAAAVARLLAIAQVRHEIGVAGERRESGFPSLSLERAEHRIAELRFAVADAEVAVRAADLPRPGRREVDEALGLRDGKRTNQDLVVEREHRRRRADAEREHDDDDEGEAGPQPKLAQGEFELIHGSPGDGVLRNGSTPCRLSDARPRRSVTAAAPRRAPERCEIPPARGPRNYVRYVQPASTRHVADLLTAKRSHLGPSVRA